MIIDTIDESERYHAAHALLPAAFRFIRSLAPAVADGRPEIDGDNLFAIVQSYTTGPAGERRLEHHRRYADIQCVLSGEELIEHAPLSGLPVETPYDSEKDFGVVRDPPLRTAIVMRPGQFGVFFPTDAHKPGCAVDTPVAVRKVVVKLRV